MCAPEKSGDPLKGLLLVLPFEVVWLRIRRSLDWRLHAMDVHETIRIFVRKRAKQHGVHDAEDSSVGAYAQSQCNDGNGGEARTLEHRANSVAGVVKKSFHGSPSGRGIDCS